MDANMRVAELRMGTAEHIMLRLDDELAGLIEAADIPADQAGAHSTKPDPASSVAGKCIMLLLVCHVLCCAVLCCAVLCCAVLCCAVLRHAVPCCAMLFCAAPC